MGQVAQVLGMCAEGQTLRAQVAQVLGMCAEGQTLRAPGLAFETWENTKLRYAVYSFGQ